MNKEELNKEITKTLEKVKEELKSCGYNGIITKRKHYDDHIKVSKKNIARIEISCSFEYRLSEGRKIDGFHVKVFRKNEYGGYKIDDKDGPYLSKWRNKSREVPTIKCVIDIVKYFFELPEVHKKKNKPKDDRNAIFQNAIARAIQEQSNCGNISYLAKKEDEGCYIKLHHVGARIGPKFITILWGTLYGEYAKKIGIQPSSPSFDPQPFIDFIIDLDKRLIEVQDSLSNIDKSAKKLEKVSGC